MNSISISKSIFIVLLITGVSISSCKTHKKKQTILSEKAHSNEGVFFKLSLAQWSLHKYVEENNGKIADEGLRQKIAKSDMDGHAFSLTLKRVSEESKNSNHGPSAATSIFKYCGSEHNKRKYEIMIEAMGTQGLGWEGGEFDPLELAITRDWLRTKANSIEGGTSEVQLNVISKRVLDLPQQ